MASIEFDAQADDLMNAYQVLLKVTAMAYTYRNDPITVCDRLTLEAGWSRNSNDPNGALCALTHEVTLTIVPHNGKLIVRLETKEEA